MYSIVFLAATAFLLCYVLTPLVARCSRRMGLLDQPNPERKLHAVALPRTGGIAVVVSYVAALVVLFFSPLNGADVVNLPLVLRLLPAVVVVFATGVLDDVVGLNARAKLTGQVAAACLAYWAGVQVNGVTGWLAPAWLGLPLTVLWLVACSNAFNLIDGVDGLAAGIGASATFTMLLAALLHEHAALALATAPLLGALLAFLRYNFNPASIFLGDSGSLTVGFVLGCFGALWSQKSATLLGMAAPLMALVVPLLDAGVAIVRRFLRRQPIFSPDRNHLHHRLLDRGFGPRKVVLILYGACGVAAAFSLLETMPANHFDGLILVTFCLAVWVGVYSVGYLEFDAARQLMFSGTFRHILNAKLYVGTFEKKVATAESVEDYWHILRDVGREFGCAHVRMALRGRVFEEHNPEYDLRPCCVMRIPLSESEYVNFKYPSRSSVRHAVAISSIVEVIQQSLAARKPRLHPLPQKAGRPVRLAHQARPLRTVGS